MKKMMKRALALMLTLCAFSGLAADYPMITTYSDLLSILSKGENVKGILALHQCTSVEKNPVKEMIGSLNFTNFNAYEIQDGAQPKSVIATSTTMLVESSQFGPVYNYVRLRVFKDNSAEVLSELLNPQTFKPQRQNTYICKLSDGVIQGGITLYKIS